MVASNDDYSDFADPMPVDVYGPSKTAGTRRAAAPPMPRKSSGGTAGWVFIAVALLVAVPGLLIGALTGEPVSLMVGSMILAVIGGSLVVRAAVIERG